ncbi:DUF7118 family protein [Halomicrococcus gelatinilyticus]|uniref:DUF7118 family protein n=1 Tax=Halomicrococcus gelatinilyticus TaxID=1702103 RepID=UPI002E142287
MTDRVAALRDADEAYREVDAAIAERGEATVERVADAHRRATDLLDRYEERATGTGDFEAFVRFQGEFTDLVEDLPDDLPQRDAFERAEDVLDRRRLSERHFEQVREELAAAREIAALLDERAETCERYRDARRAVSRRTADLDDRVADLERLLELGDADLAAPVDHVRDPIEAYDEAVAAAFAEFRREASAREVVAFLAATENYPLVEFAPPPQALREYVADADVADEPIPDLLEYAGYSRSKLDHYVDDPARLKRCVATNETYLDRLDAGPLQVGWPPRPASELRWWCEEAVRVVDRFAPPSVVERLHDVAALARDEDEFERVRTAARARAELTDEERRRLEDGAVAAELEEARAERDRLEDALAEYPER